MADIGDYCGSLRSYCSICEEDRAVCSFDLDVNEAKCRELHTAVSDDHPEDILPLLGMSSVPGIDALVDTEGSCTFTR